MPDRKRESRPAATDSLWPCASCRFGSFGRICKRVGRVRFKIARAGQDDMLGAMTPPFLTLADRIRGCLWGEIVGDAMCLGSHWIYNLGEMEQKFPGGPKGFEAPPEGHYHYPKEPGDLTHYGEGALVMLESIASQGHLDLADYWLRFFEHFGSPEYVGYLEPAIDQFLKGEPIARTETASYGCAIQSVYYILPRAL